MKKLIFIFLLSPLTLLAQTCPIDGEVMLYSGVTTGERGTLNIYTCSNGHNSYVNISGSGGTTSGSSGSSSSGSSSSNSADVMKNAAIEGYNLARYGNVNGKQDNTSSEAYNQLLIEYKALKLSHDKLAKKYNQLLNQRNSNRTSSNLSANRQSTAYSNTSKSSSNYIKPGISFLHLKQPKLFGGDWGTYTSGLTDIEFVNDKLYRSYYRKVRIKGYVGYINMNTFK